MTLSEDEFYSRELDAHLEARYGTAPRGPSILSPSFRYVPAARIDIRETFARERARLAALKGERATVQPIRRGKI